ncbi:MAG: preprotein translocase subunit SecA [Gemmataceae bacterium]|nr:preprotein translocase subunit SecA [Gemmataceae bacterium]
MSSEPKPPATTIWERIGDGFSWLSEGVGNFLLRLFGSKNERDIKKLGYIRPPKGSTQHTVIPGSMLDMVNKLEPQMQALDDAGIKAVGDSVRERLAKGAALDDVLPEVFAACREAAFRHKNMRHFDVQIVGGAVLHGYKEPRGKIAEMTTGEGKTLVATLPAVLNGLTGKGVHVVTVNDYLARRDCEWMMPIYRALGVTAGYIQSDMDPEARRAAYECDITYGTNSEFGFDYLRDNMKTAKHGDTAYPSWQRQVQRPLNYAIIDEVDNILIDEARTPLIISGQAHGDVKRYDKANQIAIQLTDLQKSAPGKYFEVKEKEHGVHLTDEGVAKAEELAGVESFYTAGNMEWPHLIDNALKAHHLYKRDKRYAVIRDEEGSMSIVIIDEFTGRLMMGRQWSDGLHQAVEAKHARDGVRIKEETQTLATVTLQNYFKMYKKLAGMTGTAMTEADEFWKIYKLEVVSVPTNRPLLRKDAVDLIYRTEKEKWKAVVDEVAEVHKTGRPILIGTTDVDKSIKLSDMLKRRGVKHELLNALPEHAAREADIVAQAGRIGAVTIATNMAGRGTDIILGGNPETMAWSSLRHKYASRLDVPEDEWKATVDAIEAKEKCKEEGRKVAGMGGLHIVGTERHEARRIDNQLRGRAGRQGDPGSSRFYLCLEDDLMRIFAGEWVSAVLKSLGMEEGQPIESGMVSRRITAAQKKIEERNFDSRKHLLEYDEVMDHQRKTVYGYRQEILNGANCKTRVLDMFDKQIALAVERFLDPDYGAESFAQFAGKQLGLTFDDSDFARSDYEEAARTAKDKAHRQVTVAVDEAIEENLGEEDQKGWNWNALAHAMNTRFGLKTTDRELKAIGKDGLFDFFVPKGEAFVEAVDLSEGRKFLEKDWGLDSLLDWARLKFGIKAERADLVGESQQAIRDFLGQKVRELYHQKEAEFPVTALMAEFMSERGQGAGQKFNREGLYLAARERFPAFAARLSEEVFRTEPRTKVVELLNEASRTSFPPTPEEAIDAKLKEVFEGANRKAEADDAKELAEWARTTYQIAVTDDQLLGKSADEARQHLWNTYDAVYRPEMRRMERSLVLNQLDLSWKNHLYQMDHLKAGIGLVGYAQEDPKTAYKQEGMKEFKAMWEGVEDKVTDTVFRMEQSEAFEETIWLIGETRHEAAPRLHAEAMAAQQQQAGQEVKKVETIRNRSEKVGRNDPCPCGSGKKYKNCHMKG